MAALTLEKYKELLRKFIENYSDKSIYTDRFEFFKGLNLACTIDAKKSFFRYRPLSEYTLTEIINQEIFMSKLDAFDDAYEGRYLIDADDLKKGINHDWIDHCNEYYQRNVKVSCFTTNNKNIPMWYYYAEKHQGICIEYKYGDFNLSSNMVFLPVIYPKTTEKSVYKFIPSDEFWLEYGAIINSLLKNRTWNFEDEWRVILVPCIEKKQCLPLKIEKIYLGANISTASIDVIKNIIEKNELDIQLKEMVMTDAGLAAFDYGVIPLENRIRI